MITTESLPSDPPKNCDPERVAILVNTALQAMRDTCVPGVTTTQEVLSACFTLLQQMLLVMTQYSAAEDRDHNRREIGRVLDEMKVMFGSPLQ